MDSVGESVAKSIVGSVEVLVAGGVIYEGVVKGVTVVKTGCVAAVVGAIVVKTVKLESKEEQSKAAESRKQ